MSNPVRRAPGQMGTFSDSIMIDRTIFENDIRVP